MAALRRASSRASATAVALRTGSRGSRRRARQEGLRHALARRMMQQQHDLRARAKLLDAATPVEAAVLTRRSVEQHDLVLVGGRIGISPLPCRRNSRPTRRQLRRSTRNTSRLVTNAANVPRIGAAGRSNPLFFVEAGARRGGLGGGRRSRSDLGFAGLQRPLVPRFRGFEVGDEVPWADSGSRHLELEGQRDDGAARQHAILVETRLDDAMGPEYRGGCRCCRVLRATRCPCQAQPRRPVRRTLPRLRPRCCPWRAAAG